MAGLISPSAITIGTGARFAFLYGDDHMETLASLYFATIRRNSHKIVLPKFLFEEFRR